jgi:hypothetical protein
MKLFGENHANVAKSYKNIGAVYGKLNDRHKELEFYQKSLAIRIKLFLEIDGHVAVHEEIVSGDVGLRIGALWI